jgi:hypothetical protein
LKEYYRRVRKILRTELNSKNKMTALNTWAVLIDWLKKIEKTDWEARILTIEGIHPKADVNKTTSKDEMVDRICRTGGGIYWAAIVGLSEYIKEGRDSLTRLVQG